MNFLCQKAGSNTPRPSHCNMRSLQIAWTWWKNRKENERAWKVSADEILKYDEAGNLISANLDIKNPNSKQDFEHMPPEQLVEDILKKEQRIIEIMGEIKQVLAQEPKA